MSEEKPGGRSHSAYLKAVAYVVGEQRISTAGIQRKFKMGYGEASKVIEAMEADGVCSEPTEKGMRQVLPKTINDWNPAARKGLALEKLGVLMQNPQTTIKDLAGAAHDAGLKLALSIDDDTETPA